MIFGSCVRRFLFGPMTKSAIFYDMTEIADKILAIMTPHADGAGGLIKALNAVQKELGYLPPEAESAGAEIFNLSKAEVKGVISFYSDFRREPAGRTVVRLCVAEACQAVGSRKLQGEVEQELAIGMGATSADGKVTLEPVYCLGLCSVGPAAMVGGQLVARATVQRIEQKIAQRNGECG